MNIDIIKNRKAILMAITDAGGIGPRMFQHLLMHLGAPEDIILASYADFEEIPRLGDEGIRKILNSFNFIADYESRLEAYTYENIGVVTYLDTDYPENLREISDPPPVIYYKGNNEAWNAKYIAMVGTTKASQESIRMTVDLSRELVKRGLGIISGLAVGIDSAAHLGALKENGRTIAVLGCGISNIYPRDNITLSENIEKDGLLVSEYDPARDVTKPGLVLRNRLITALSSAVVVTQIGDNTSGELKTAGYAIKQAKPLFYANPDNSLNHDKIKDLPGVIIGGAESADEIIKYVV